MEIRHRMGFPRSIFHVMNRGARRVSIFADEADRRIFVSLLGRFALKYELRILSWCLMPNHYHLEPDAEGTPLCGMMRDLDGNYARSFNERHDTTGCLFQGPFKSMLIDDPVGIAYVSRYIHLNPVDMNEPPGDYEWSSCKNYLGMADPPDWLNLEPVSEILRNPECSDVEAYDVYLQAGLNRPRKKKVRLDPMGDFHAEWIRHLEERCIERLTGHEQLLGATSVQTLVCFLAHRIHNVPAEAVAAYFGYSGAAGVRALCGRLQKRLGEDPALEEALRTVTISATQKR